MKLILSIDGGGVKVLVAIKFLQELEKHFNKKIYDIFDCYAGTSAGALLTAMIAYSKTDISVILNDIFTHKNLITMFDTNLENKLIGEYLRPKYTGIGKRNLIDKYIPDLSVSNTKKDVLIAAYDVDNNAPIFFKSYNEKINIIKHKIKYTDLINETKIRDAVDGSSSATTYFPPVNVNNVQIMDGAICTNNPCDCIYADILQMYPGEDIRILSIGISHYKLDHYDLSDTKTWGAFQWFTKGSIITRFTSVDFPLVDYRMKSFCRALGHKYIRVEPVEPNSIPLDSVDINDYNKLLDIGTDMFNHNLKNIDEFFK